MCIRSLLTRLCSSLLSFLVVTVVLAVPAVVGQDSQSKETKEETVGFDKVQPILRKRCQNCHNSEELRGDLSVTDMTALAVGSSSGPVVVAGKPRESLLYTTAAHLDEPTMPPNSRKISGRELDLIRRWIEDGLVKKSGDQPADLEMPSKSNTNEPENQPEASVSLEPVKSLLQPTALSSIALDPSGKLAALPGDQQIALLDLQSQTFKAAIPFPEPEVTQLAFTKDGKQLLAGGGAAGLSGSVFGFDIESGNQLFKIADESDSVLALDVSPNNQLVAFGGPSKLLKVCKVTDGTVVHTMRKHTDWVMCAQFSHDGLLLASADRFGGIFVWEAASGELFHALDGHTGPVHSLVWDGDGETLLSAGEDGQVRVWNMHHGELTAQWDGGVGAILSMDRAPSATLVGGRNGLVKIWTGPESCVATYDAQEQVDHALIADDSTCVVTDSSGGIHCLSIPKLEPVKLLSFPVHNDARNQLLVRLERKSADFEAELKIRQQQALAMASNNTQESRPKPLATAGQDAISQSGAPAHSGKGNMAELVEALQSEVDLAAETLAAQSAERERTELRLAKLQAELERKSAAVDATRSQVERLQEMLQLANRAASNSSQVDDE